MQLNQLLLNLWNQYIEESPEALKIHQLFIDNGETVINDHIAFRTFADSRVDVEALGKIFINLGYKECEEYNFPHKKLYARHFEHQSDSLQPKIFISQLKTQEFSFKLQNIAQQCIAQIPITQLNTPEMLYSGRFWPEIDYHIYQELLAESDYAAWLYVFGFRANHFTVAVNHLQKLNDLIMINNLLKANNFNLNHAGGEIKGSPQELLEQSSTMANKVLIKFKQGTYTILNSYYEFAKRYPQKNGTLYQGFISSSADKLFESTNN